MKKIVVGGQLLKDEVARDLKHMIAETNSNIEISVKSDLEAAIDLKKGEVDYYIGVCETGAGGAVAIAMALLGREKTVTIATASSYMSEPQIAQHIEDGKIAFGISATMKDKVLFKLVKNLIKTN